MDRLPPRRPRDKPSIFLAPPWELNRTLRARNIAQVLCRHYPGHRWLVGFPDYGGGVIIRHQDLPSRFSVFIREPDLDEPHYRTVMRQAGCLLEAYRLHRGRFRLDQFEALPRGPGGLVLPDLDAVPPNNLPEQLKSADTSMEPAA